MYLRVANSAPAALPPGVRAVPLPTVVTPKGVVRGMGYVLVGRPRGLRGLRGCGLRGCGLRGLGYPTPAGPTPQAVITDDVNLVGMAYPVGFTPDMLRANVAADVASTCSTWPEQCPGGAGAYSSLIDAAVNQAIAAGKFGPIVQAGGVVNTGVPYDPQAYLRPNPPAAAPASTLAPTVAPAAIPAPVPSTVLAVAPAPASGLVPASVPAGGAPAPAGSGFSFSSLSQPAATVGGFGVPWWALLAVGGVAIYAMGSSGKR